MGALRHPTAHCHRLNLFYFLVGANGSSLPNCSGLPVALNLSERAFDRWTASSIISGVAVVRGTLLAVVVEVEVDVDVVVDVVWADAEVPAMA